jgi:hypothetical protein
MKGDNKMNAFDMIHWKYLVSIKKLSIPEIEKIVPELVGQNFGDTNRAFLKSCNFNKHKELKFLLNKFPFLKFKPVEIVTPFNKEKIPDGAGIYLIGNTSIDIKTNKVTYWLKVGYSLDMRKRMSNYNSSNPTFNKIDYYMLNKNITTDTKRELKVYETICHFALNQIANSRICAEWFSVCKEDYLQVCTEGFSWFGLV